MTLASRHVLTDPLPGEGLLCVEASAGTGKTHLLSALATRWLVERDDVTVANLLVVTYTVAAAAELRGRIRSHLAAAARRLAPDGQPGEDPYLEDLAASPRRAAAHARATRALADYDTAMIRTIHAFAAWALESDRRAGGPAEDLRIQAVTDVLSARAFDAASPLWQVPRVGDTSLDEVLKLLLDHPDMTAAPSDAAADGNEPALEHRRAVDDARGLFTSRQRLEEVLTFADLLTTLDDEVADDRSRVLRAIRSRFRVGLIDEFQDTDPIQWRIFQRLFLDEPGRTLVVVGDPKQAIYGFRGADVTTYLEAKSAAEDTGRRGLGVASLAENHRSDQVLLDALNGVLSGSHFDEGGAIEYVSVRATPRHAGRRLVDASGEPVVPLGLRVLTYGENAYAKRLAIADDCAREAERMLRCGVLGADGRTTPISADDVVVLCAKRIEFPLLKEAFLRRGLRSTEARSDDVLDSAAAVQLDVLLRALCDPGRESVTTALAHSWFGATTDGTAALDVIRSRLASWEGVLARRGVAALGRAVTSPDVVTGPLAGAGSERHLTDVQHLFDLLTVEGRPSDGPSALLERLAELRATDRQGGDEDTRARRIDTDAPAIRLMTAHGAKGLEFGVVLCPFVQRHGRRMGPAVWREPDGRRFVDAGGGAPWTDTSLTAATAAARDLLANAEDGGESRRLLYVALTRARHRCVVWWAPAHDGPSRRRDELAGLLFDRDEHGRPRQLPRAARAGEDGECYDVARGHAATALTATFSGLVDAALLEVSDVEPRSRAAVDVPAAPSAARAAGDAPLGVATIARSLAVRDLRCSFSSLVAGAAHDEAAGDTSGDDGAADEGPSERTDPAGDDPFGGLAGPTFGTAVHDALEAAVARAPGSSFDDVARDTLAGALTLRSLPVSDAVAEGLLAATSAPIAGGPSISQLARDDVATELRFTLPVAEGVDVAALGSCLARHDPDGPYAPWAARVAAARPSRPLAELLVGSIDLVTTLGTGDRFVVIDYKTNLASPSAEGYGPEALHAAMQAADYPLQAALYLVALHRYLRWRVADYDPGRHLAGSHYLFLRGMRPGTTDGVSSWALPGAAVASLSDLLAGRA